MALDDFKQESEDEYGLELVRVRKENDQLKNQQGLLMRMAKKAIVQQINGMDIAAFLQFLTAYEELQKGR